MQKIFETQIVTEKRNGDWIAYIKRVPSIWEAGQNELEAIEKMIIRLQGWGGAYRVKKVEIEYWE